MSSHLKTQKGFIALISILIISAVLLATTISLGQFGIASRYFILHLEQKAVSEKLADGCVHIERIKVFNDPFYEVDTPLSYPIGDEACTVFDVSADGNESTLEVGAQTGDAVTNLQVVVNNETGDFVSWTEVASF